MNNDNADRDETGIVLLKRLAEATEVILMQQHKRTLKKLNLSKNLKVEPNYWIMMPDVAEEIINSYWDSFKKLDGKNEIVQPISDLPFSSGRIKYAHFAYAESLILNFVSTKEILDQLIESYGDINRRFVKDPTSTNTVWKQYRDNLDNGVISEDPFLRLTEIALEDNIEFNNFIAESIKFLKK